MRFWGQTYLLILISISILPWTAFAASSDGASHEQDELILAIKEHSTERVIRILSNPQSINNINFTSLNTYGLFRGTVLSLAVSVGNLRIVHEVLKGIKVQAKGENTDPQLNLPDQNGRTPLNLASTQGDVEIMDALIANGARVNQLSQDGWTSLHLASENGYLVAVQHLVEKGAKLDIPIQNGDTPLHLAAALGHPEVVRYLIRRGAQVDQLNHAGRSSLHLASMNGRADVVKVLLESDASVNRSSEGGSTPLHLACSRGQSETVRALLDKGANLNLVDANGRTPLFVAAEKRDRATVDVLLRERAASLMNEFKISFDQNRPDIAKFYIDTLNASEYESRAACAYILSIYKQNVAIMELHQLNTNFKCAPCSDPLDANLAGTPSLDGLNCIR